MQNEFTSDKRLVQVYDSLMQHRKDNELINKNFEDGLLHKIEKSSCPVEVMALPNGKMISFGTSNNEKVKELVNKVPDISPVEFLLELRNIEGEIKVEPGVFPSDWIKRDYFPVLFELAGMDVKMPAFSILSGPPYGANNIDEYSLKKASYCIIPGMSMGHNAVIVLNSYFRGGFFPSGSYKNLELIKEWYASGKPKEEFIRMLKDYNMKK